MTALFVMPDQCDGNGNGYGTRDAHYGYGTCGAFYGGGYGCGCGALYGNGYGCGYGDSYGVGISKEGIPT